MDSDDISKESTGLYWVSISQKNGSLLGPYLKAWGSLIVLPTVQYSPCCEFLRLGTNILALLYLRHIALPYISILGLYIRLQTYILPIYRQQISFSSPRNKYIAKI